MPQREQIGPVTPLLIVRDLGAAVAYYRDMLGFACRNLQPADDPFFAIVGRDTAQVMLKVISNEVLPLPNHARHAWALWDAFVYVANPDALAAEFASRDVVLRTPLADTDDGLRGFEVADVDGYVIFFGRPCEG